MQTAVQTAAVQLLACFSLRAVAGHQGRVSRQKVVVLLMAFPLLAALRGLLMLVLVPWLCVAQSAIVAARLSDLLSFLSAAGALAAPALVAGEHWEKTEAEAAAAAG